MSRVGVIDAARARLAAPPHPERLSLERLEDRARQLARSYDVDRLGRRRARNLGPRFDADVRVLTEAYRALTDDARENEPVSAAGEWLLDNFHVITAEARRVRQHF